MGRAGTVLVAAAVLLLSACGSWIVTYDGTGPTTDLVLAPDGSDAYTFSSAGGRLRALPLPTNSSGNLRAVFLPEDAPAVTDSQSCATWADASGGNTQQGAAMRVIRQGGAVRAVTVTKNILFGVGWVFNVHVWDSSRVPEWTLMGQIDLRSVLKDRPYPWHVCARALGQSVEVLAWTGSEPEPWWNDGVHGGVVSIGPEWVYPGGTGWYIGHLQVGGFAEFTGLKTWRYDAAGTAPAARATGPDTPGRGPDRVTVSATA